MKSMHRVITRKPSRSAPQFSACLQRLSGMSKQCLRFVQGQRSALFSRLSRLLAIPSNEQHVLLATTARRPFELSWCRRLRAAEGKC